MERRKKSNKLKNTVSVGNTENFIAPEPSSTVEIDSEREEKCDVYELLKRAEQAKKKHLGKCSEELSEKRNYLLRNNVQWNNRELSDLCGALQRYGFAETAKIAEAIKTKDENAVKNFMRIQTNAVRSKFHKRHIYNSWHNPKLRDLVKWPDICKWRKLISKQMSPDVLSEELSGPTMLALCQKFYELEEEPENPEVINIKMIYKYILDCMSGKIPAQLPPKESAAALMLLKDLDEITSKFDFKDEFQFIKEFRSPIKFVSSDVKDEFSSSNEVDDSLVKPDVVIPHDLYLRLQQHKKTTQSFNAINAPMWLLNKEQKYITQKVHSIIIPKEEPESD